MNRTSAFGTVFVGAALLVACSSVDSSDADWSQGVSSSNDSLRRCQKGSCDATAPQVSITNPISGSTISGVTMVIGQASDNVGVAKVELSVDGGAYALASGTTNWSISVNAGSLATGSHVLSVRATDGAGNAGTTSTTVVVGSTSCGASLASRTSITSIDIAPATASGNRVFSAATSSGGTVLSWADANSKVHITELGADGSRVRSDVLLDGWSPEGLAISDQRYALVVSDITGASLRLVIVDRASGAVISSKQLLETYEKYWGQARVAWDGAKFGVYFGRNATHQGDALRYFASDGTELTAAWTWGCSHSLDLRLAHNGTRMGPVCVSDCLPEKAIMFNHREAVISSEPSGDCGGYSSAQLGGLVPTANGFWVSYQSDAGRRSSDIALAFVSNAGVVSTPTWLTNSDRDNETSPHLAAYAGGLLAGWDAGGTRYLLRLDSSGSAIGTPETTAGTFRAWPYNDDFITYPDQSAGWGYVSNGQLVLARVKNCP